MIKSRSRSPIRREDRPGGEGRRRDRYEEEEGQDRRKIIHGWRTNDARGRFDARWRISEGQENGRNGIDGKTERRGRGIDGMDDKRTVTKTEQKIIPSVVIPRNGVKTEAKVELKGELCVKTEPNNSTESWESESSNKTLGGGSAWGGSSWEIPSEVKLESSELSEWAEEKKTVISPHYSFAEICDTLKEEALQNNNDLPLPVFELFLESVKGFASRRCSVSALGFIRLLCLYNVISSVRSIWIMQRMMRGLTLSVKPNHIRNSTAEPGPLSFRESIEMSTKWRLLFVPSHFFIAKAAIHLDLTRTSSMLETMAGPII